MPRSIRPKSMGAGVTKVRVHPLTGPGSRSSDPTCNSVTQDSCRLRWALALPLSLKLFPRYRAK